MKNHKPILGILLIGLTTGEAFSQVYSQAPLLFTNMLASSAGGTDLLGVSLGQNTTVQGGISFVLGGNTSEIHLTLDDGVSFLHEDDSGFVSAYNLTQDVGSSTLTISFLNSTPWGGSLQDEVFLPASAMRSDAQSTFQYAVFGSGGRFGFSPGVTYGQYHSIVTISDGATTAVFGPTPAPEPDALALCLIGGLAGMFIAHRRL